MMNPDPRKAESLLRQTAVKKLDGAASGLAGQQTLTQIFLATLVPFETAARLRKHFRVGHHHWTVISPG